VTHGVTERPLVFACEGTSLLGILATPANAQPFSRGVVVAVGGPQYRAGSHRQFTLLCRHLASAGIASIRFDFRGMGDSEGSQAQDVEEIFKDIRSAIDVFLKEAPHVREVALWGLCGAASAAALYTPGDSRVTGIAMLNPWVRTERGRARAQLRHYYLSRLMTLDVWRQLLRGKFKLGVALKSFLANVRDAIGVGSTTVEPTHELGSTTDSKECRTSRSLPDSILDALSSFGGRVLIILSTNDLTANEFREIARGSRRWRSLLNSARITRHDLVGANHTFSRSDWRNQVAESTVRWVTHSGPRRSNINAT